LTCHETSLREARATTSRLIIKNPLFECSIPGLVIARDSQ
jgi:hypothetical protein